MTATSLDLSQIKTDALSSAATFRTLIGVDIASFATSAQGALADTALQPSDITSGTITAGTGNIDFDAIGASSPLTLTAALATETPLTIKGAASQTAPIIQYVNSSNTLRTHISAAAKGSANVEGSICNGSLLATIGWNSTDWLVFSGGNGTLVYHSVLFGFGSGNEWRALTSGHIQLPTGTGTKIGTATTQKLGFWNATPVVQQVLATGASATVDDVISLLQTIGLCRQS